MTIVTTGGDWLEVKIERHAMKLHIIVWGPGPSPGTKRAEAFVDANHAEALETAIRAVRLELQHAEAVSP